MSISKRLKQIAELVTPGNVTADIGTDHGYVPIYLLLNNISPRAVAADVSKGSVIKAKENVEHFGLSDKIDCRLADGLKAIVPGEVDTVVISGMGGILMTDIMDEGLEVFESLKEVILSPHRDLELVKTFVVEHGFRITEEIQMEDKKKKYNIIKALNTRISNDNI